MKKTFTRALSLILVLVALLGVMPTAFADEMTDFGATEAITATASSATVKAGESITLTASVPYDSDRFEAPTVEWYPEDVGVGTVVKDATDPFKATFTAGENTGAVMITMVATALGAQSGNPFTVTKTVSVTIEAADTEGGETEEHAYSVTFDPAELTLAVGEESAALEPIVKDGDMVLPKDKYDFEGFTAVKVDGKDIVSVDGDGVFKGVAVGETKVEATVTIKETGAEVNGFVKVKVVEAAASAVIECKNDSVKAAENYTLKPVLKVNGKEVTDVEFEFVPAKASTSISVSADKKTATIANRKGGAVEVTVSVEKYKPTGADSYITGDDVEIEPIKVLVWFYDTNNVSMTLNTGKTKVTLEEDKVFSKIDVNGSILNSLYNDFSFARIFEFLMEVGDYEGKPDRIQFSPVSGYAAGAIVDAHGYALSEKFWNFLDQAWFAQTGNRTGSSAFYYQIVDKEGLVMMAGTCTIVITGGEGDIHYETTSGKAVTLKESDFQKFWNDQKLGIQYKLKFVTFDVAGMSGTLYTDSTKKTKVNAGMSFYLNPTTTTQYDLGKVYYVPNIKDTTEYVDGFNFTAYSDYTSTNVSGTVTIGVNTKSAASITSRGILMSSTYTKDQNNKNVSYAAAIADTYKANTAATLGYVVFDLPEAKYGKLYSKLPTETKVVHGSLMNMTYVAEGTELKKDDKVWYEPKLTTDLKLTDVAYIPAAGFKGEVELTYSAYDAYGNYQYNGKLRLNVAAKTASGIFSDVTSKSYSWAADSADFLYYEGVAQGSKAAGTNSIKYNPSANITRRDFMLMLYRAFLADDYETFNVTSNFPDVVKGKDTYSQEIYQAVGVAKYLGIAQGSNDKFNPKANITRQEAMVLIYRTLDVINKDLEYTTTANVAAFKDASKISSWALTSISYLVNHGVIQGTNDMVNPLANITRAEMACILHRVLTY